MIISDQERAKLALTPLFAKLESGEKVDGALCELLVRSVVLVISDERFRCFQIAIASKADEIAVSISGGNR